MLQRGLVGKPDKKRSAYQITQKGQRYRANPPQNPQEKSGKRVGENSGGNEQKDIEKEDEDDWDVPSKLTSSGPSRSNWVLANKRTGLP